MTEHDPTSTPKVIQVHRDAIPTLREVEVDGELRPLGILKEFRKHPAIASFLPEQARLSLAWVRLEPGERLAVHVHTTASMIVVAGGHGRILGDLEAPFGDGDVMLIPGGCFHGFEGAGAAGFWALSIQFEGDGLYERPEAPRVSFADGGGMAELLRRNREYCEAHRRNPIFAFVRDGRVEDPARRSRFLACVQVLSSFYQRAVLCRSVFTDEPKLAALFRDHLEEEWGHDLALARDRGPQAEQIWDPVLEASASWFAWKMLSLDNLEKLVLLHLVLESAGAEFHAVAAPIMARLESTNYFEQHGCADDGHATMSLSALHGHGESTYARLLDVQAQGWAMLESLCARMVELADGAVA